MKLLILTLFFATITLKSYSISDSLIIIKKNDIYINQDTHNLWANKIQFLNEYTMRLNDTTIIFFNRRCNDIMIVDNIHGSMQITPQGLFGHAFLNGKWIKQ